MKNLKNLLIIIISISVVSCSNDSSNDTIGETQAITEEEAVEIVEASLAEESAGLSETIFKYAKTYEEETSRNIQCNETVTDNYNFTHNGTLVQANYNYNWEFTVGCNQFNIPQIATFTATGEGTYTTQRIQSDDTTSFTATLTGLQPTSPDIVYAGSFLRSGSQQITTNQRNQNISSVFRSNFTDLTVSKSDFTIDSGSGNFSLFGTNNGEDFDYEGTLIFNGDNTATLIINGNEYTINLR